MSAAPALAHTALAPLLGLAAGATLPFAGRWLVELEVFGETSFLRLEDEDGLRAVWSVRSTLLLGVLF